MQLISLLTVGLVAVTSVVAAPQGGFGRGRTDDIINVINAAKTGNTGPSNANAGSNLNNNGNNNGGNTAVGNKNSNVNQASSSCANGNIVCCNGPTTNTANSNSGRLNTNTIYPQYSFLLQNLFRNQINAPTRNTNQETNTSNQCNQVTEFKAGSASPICQQTVACCSDNQGPAVANVGCTAFNIVVNTGSSPVNANGFFPKEK